MKVILVCGPVTDDNSTYSIALARQYNGVRFSIEQWMKNMFLKDATTLDSAWMMERVERCHLQIWELCEQILSVKGNVVLDLGFARKKHIKKFIQFAESVGAEYELHRLATTDDNRNERKVEKLFKKTD